MDKRIGAQFYTIRATCKELADFEESCRKVSEMGYKTIQLSGIGDFSAEDIKRIIDKYNLEVVCTHKESEDFLEHLDELIKFHKTIGCHICGVGYMPGSNAKLETIRTFIKNFVPVAEKLKENGLTLAYHNHAYEFEKIDGRYGFDILMEEFKSDNFKLILDVYWLAVAGMDIPKFIRKQKGKIACIHLKDLKMVGNSSTYAEIGQGNLEWENIIPACEEAGAEYALVEQDETDKDPFESLKISYDYLKENGYTE